MTPLLSSLTAFCFVIAANKSNAMQAPCEPRWAAGFDLVTVIQEPREMALHENAVIFGMASQDFTSAAIERWSGGVLQNLGSVSSDPFANAPRIHDFCTFDFGSGPNLVVAGSFKMAGPSPGQGVLSTNIARWNGSWATIGGGLGDDQGPPVQAVCAFDDGSGMKLYAGGAFDLPGAGSGIARWSGSGWQPVGSEELFGVRSLCVHDDGTGPALYASAAASLVGGAPSSGVVRWNGATWSVVGAASSPSTNVATLVVHDEGSGPRLFAGGNFTSIGGASAAYVARWDGSTWSGLGAGTNLYVEELVSHDDGNEHALVAIGHFTQAGGAPASRVARWSNGTWSALGTGLNDIGSAVVSFDDGEGKNLVVGGPFYIAGGIAMGHVARWRDGAWTRLTDGIGFDWQAEALITHDDGTGTKLYAGGYLTSAGSVAANHITRFEGTSWRPLGGGLTASFINAVHALATFDDGNGPQLYAGGTFTHADGMPASRIARWDGSAWAALPGGGVDSGNEIRALCVHDDGNGPALYAGGDFTQIGGITTRGIARWDGTAWSALGGGISQSSPTGQVPFVKAIASHDDGNGPALFIGGEFDDAGGTAGTRNLGGWRNGAWFPLGGPTSGGASKLVAYLGVHDDGQGPRLWLGGSFISLGGTSAQGIGTWDGTQFRPVGAGFPYVPTLAHTVRALCTFDAGSAHGPRVYATGEMLNVAGTTTHCVAAWDGTAWHAVDGGLSGYGFSMAVHDDGTGEKLWLGGGFTHAGGIASNCIARLDPSCPEPIAFCFGDGSGTACPCGNPGASGNGCATSFDSSGARLSASGIASLSADTLVLSANGLSPTPAMFFQGTQRQNGGAGSVFGDGLRCAGGTIIRLGAMPTVGGASQYPGTASDPVSVRGQIAFSGVLRTYQGWYRNAAAFCTPATFNLTNGVEIRWAP
jgi:hypothetical protein